jgi:hypothetical protein
MVIHRMGILPRDIRIHIRRKRIRPSLIPGSPIHLNPDSRPTMDNPCPDNRDTDIHRTVRRQRRSQGRRRVRFDWP